MNEEEIFKIMKKRVILEILLHLHQYGEKGSTINQLKKVTSSGTVSTYVNLLEELGLVASRTVHTKKPLDARIITLTEKGKKFVKYCNEFQERCKEI